jgi:hypothetical protein
MNRLFRGDTWAQQIPEAKKTTALISPGEREINCCLCGGCSCIENYYISRNTTSYVSMISGYFYSANYREGNVRTTPKEW